MNPEDGDNRDEIQELTRLLRQSQEAFWARLRQILWEKGVDPQGALLVESFEDDDQLEFGIVVTNDGDVFEFDFEYRDRSIGEGAVCRWEKLTDRHISSPHHARITTGLTILRAGEPLNDIESGDVTGRPELDLDLARHVIGKRLLIGLTFLDAEGDLIEQTQLHGIVEEISPSAGIVIRLADGSVYRLPPDLRGIQAAPSGIYRLRSTGEEVENPDFLHTWTITKERPDGE